MLSHAKSYLKMGSTLLTIASFIFAFTSVSISKAYASYADNTHDVSFSPASATALSSSIKFYEHLEILTEKSERTTEILLAQSSRDRRRQAVSASGKRPSSQSRNAAGGARGYAQGQQINNTSSVGRRRVMTSEKRVTLKRGRGGKTNINFDEIDITGERRDPALSFIKSESQGEGRDLVQIRKEWHDSMINSTLLVD